MSRKSCFLSLISTEIVLIFRYTLTRSFSLPTFTSPFWSPRSLRPLQLFYPVSSYCCRLNCLLIVPLVCKPLYIYYHYKFSRLRPRCHYSLSSFLNTLDSINSNVISGTLSNSRETQIKRNG